jgi:tetratricopeptide (TPR) repeat protein
MQLGGDLYFYWHIRGKNISAREYAAAFLDADAVRTPSLGRAGALITAGLASWILGQLERSKEEHSEAYRIAQAIDADRERCVAAFLGAIAMIGLDLEAAVGLARDAVEWSRRRGLVWAEGFASTIDGIVQTVAGDIETAHARYSRGLEVQRKLGDEEGAGLSLGGLAQLAAIRGDLPESLELYRQSLAAFEAIGDRAEEARILSETAWTHLRNEDAALARRYFLESVQAYIDVASVRGVGLSLIGLAATETFEQRFETAVTLAAAAEVYAHEEGIVNVYSDETPGREFVDRAREALSADEVAHATEAGRGLTIKETLDLARTPDTTPV